MDTIKEFLSPKSFSPLGFFVVIVSVGIGIILLGVVTDIEASEQRYFSCQNEEEKESDVSVQRTCFADFQAKNTGGLAIRFFVLLNFLLVIMVCLCYSLYVRSIVKYLEREDPEMQINQSTRLYRWYCIQLAVRFTLGMVFLILQWVVFYPLNFPSKYACVLSSNLETKHTNITSSDAANVTRPWYVCRNTQARNKTTLNIIVFIFNVFLTVSILLELIYVRNNARVNDNFRNDLEFFNSHLLNKDKVIENYVAKMKGNIKKNTTFYELLLPNIPGEERKSLEFDQIYTNLIMYPGRANYKFTGKRHEIFEGYVRSQEHHQSINKIENIFAPEPGKLLERPLSIMIVGRPGIGKSLLCRKILRDWACGKIFNEETGWKCFKFVYLFKFRHFNSDEKINLQQLLGRGQFSGAFPNEVYSCILSHPEKVLLIFDGLDEFGKKENIVKEEEYGSTLAETIPFSALYSKLASGKLFEGATVVTTSRPTALSYVSFQNKTFDRTLEILGFDSKQIAKYVESFCQDSTVKQKLWNHISSNANIFSLCYIPINCHIVCFSLQERLKRDEDNDVEYLPTTLTEIYENALVLIVCKHNPQYRCSLPEQEKLLSSGKFAPEVETSLKNLGEISYKGIEEDRLIFESNEVKGHEESGLLHRLPNQQFNIIGHKEQYCFIHLTIQELLAARYTVMGRNVEELQSWISEHLHEGKWEVVMQFVAGLAHHKDHSSIVGIFIRRLPGPISGEASWPYGKQKELVIRLFKCIFEISRNSNNHWKSLVAETLFGVFDVNLKYASLTDADMTAIVFILQEIKSIVSVNVAFSNITSFGCMEMCQLLKVSGSSDANECKLTTLDISVNQIGDEGLKHLSDALAKNECKLTTLHISDNQIGVEGLKHLSDALAKNECKLTTLYIDGNQIGDDGLKHLSDALAKNECKLTTLDISINQIADVGLKHLSDALAKNDCKLTTLYISDNQIGDEGLKHLSDALAKNECKLTTLDISVNRIADVGLKHLSDALAKNECKLTTLDIRVNRIADVGLKHLSDALAKNECKLTTLYIKGNQIGDDGLKHLSDALAKNECKLTTLDIRVNQIADVGIKHLSDALAKNECKLTTLYIGDNQIDDEGLKHLSDALAKNECKLTTLDISVNRIADVGLKHLSDALAKNDQQSRIKSCTELIPHL